MTTGPTGPGRADRAGIDLMQLLAMFPDEPTAVRWFEETLWQGQRCCGHCGSVRTSEVPNGKPMPNCCADCRSYFSVRTGTVIARSHVPLQKWAIARYLCLTGLKSVSSMKLHRDIGVSQKTDWSMLMRIREAWDSERDEPYNGPVEVDETYVGGKRKNMPNSKRKVLTVRGPVGKTAVVEAKDRETNQVAAKMVTSTDKGTLQDFVTDRRDLGAMVYTDAASAYVGLPRTHQAVKHSAKEYIREEAHTNGVESFWSMLKRAYVGTFHNLSAKHLDRYVQEFAGEHHIRDLGTLAQMRDTVVRLVGRSPLYRELVADNGLPSGARS